jgi:hypothetical protein
MDENFYTSLENTYEAALKLIYQNGLLKKFKTRALSITDNSVNIGWGFHDSLEAVYYEYYD